MCNTRSTFGAFKHAILLLLKKFWKKNKKYNWRVHKFHVSLQRRRKSLFHKFPPAFRYNFPRHFSVKRRKGGEKKAATNQQALSECVRQIRKRIRCATHYPPPNLFKITFRYVRFFFISLLLAVLNIIDWDSFADRHMINIEVEMKIFRKRNKTIFM